MPYPVVTKSSLESESYAAATIDGATSPVGAALWLEEGVDVPLAEVPLPEVTKTVPEVVGVSRLEKVVSEEVAKIPAAARSSGVALISDTDSGVERTTT